MEVAPAFNPSTWEAEAGSSLWVRDQLGLQELIPGQASKTTKKPCLKQTNKQTNKTTTTKTQKGRKREREEERKKERKKERKVVFLKNTALNHNPHNYLIFNGFRATLTKRYLKIFHNFHFYAIYHMRVRIFFCLFKPLSCRLNFSYVSSIPFLWSF